MLLLWFTAFHILGSSTGTQSEKGLLGRELQPREKLSWGWGTVQADTQGSRAPVVRPEAWFL